MSSNPVQVHVPTPLNEIEMDRYAATGKVKELDIDFTRLFAVLYSNMDAQITLADSKAQLILGANAILIAAVAVNRGAVQEIVLNTAASLGERLHVVLTIGMLAALTLSVFYALMATRPNLVRGQRKNGMFFFGHIVSLDEDTYIDRFMDMNITEIKTAFTSQIHAKAQVAERKFRRVRHSLDFLFLAVIFWAVARIVLISL